MAISFFDARRSSTGSATFAPASAKHSCGGDGAAAVERIDIGGIIAVVELDDEMPREADAEHRHRQAARDFHVHHRERDGNADAALEHLVQATVAGIEEIVFIAVKAEFAEEVALRGLDEIAAVVEIAQAVAQLRGQFVQAVEPGLGFEAGRVDGGQLQRGVVEASLGGIFFEQIAEMVRCGHPLLLCHEGFRAPPTRKSKAGWRTRFALLSGRNCAASGGP